MCERRFALGWNVRPVSSNARTDASMPAESDGSFVLLQELLAMRSVADVIADAAKRLEREEAR